MNHKFKLTLDSNVYEVESKGEILIINGQEITFKMADKSIQIGGVPHNVEVQGNTAIIDGIAYVIKTEGLEEQKAHKKRKVTTVSGEEAGAINAIMPGMIIKILKEEGDTVQTGDVIVILEAMKMQNELQAKKSGILKKIFVKTGDSVEMNQPIALVE